MLTIVIPVGTTGVKHLKSSVDSMEFLGGLQKHSVIFCAVPSALHAATEQAQRIKAICPQTFVEQLPREPETVGPFGAFNAIFRDCVELLNKRGNKNPWMWWEEDVTAIRPGWADRLELEYHRGGMPFMGVRRKASDVMRALDGSKLDDKDPRVQGDYMVAVGVYPPDFKDRSVMYKHPDPRGQMPTDVNIRHEVNRQLLNTPIIAHHWKTGNYRRGEQGRILCDDFEHNGLSPSYAGVVSEMAFVVHGDKTGSLSRLIVSETPSNVSTMTLSTAATSEPNYSSEASALKAENAELRLDIQRMNEQFSKKENSYAAEIEELQEKLVRLTGKANAANPPPAAALVASPSSPEADIVEKPVPAAALVHQRLMQAGKKILLSELAADFKCNKADLRRAIEAEPSLNIAKAGPPWVSLAA